MDPRSRPLNRTHHAVRYTPALFLGLLALADSSPVAGAPPATLVKEAQGKWSAGEAARTNRQWIECIENFSDVVALDPKSLEAQLNLGYCQSQLGQWKDAAKTYEGALALPASDSVRVEILNALAFAQGSADDQASALKTYEQLIRVQPNDKSALVGYASTLRDQGRPVDAVMAYERALELDPNDVTLLRSLGDLCQKNEMVEQAVAVYERWAAIDSTNVEPYRHLGYLLAKGKACQRGVQVYEKVIALDPSNPGDLLNLGILYQSCDMSEQAFQTLSRYREQRPEDATAVDCRLAFLYEDMGKVDEGLAVTQERAQKRPEDACLQYAWGRLLEKQGIEFEKKEKYGEAVASYRQAEARLQGVLGDPQWGKGATDELERLEKLIHRADGLKKKAEGGGQ
jgi:tetratricopeptide (TPR) repeat protein